MENTVIQNLLDNDMYFNKVFIHLDETLFNKPENLLIFKAIRVYYKEQSKKPTLREIGLDIKESNTINKTLQLSTLKHFKEILSLEKIQNIEFILKKTHTWVQRQKLTQSIFKAADIIKSDGEFEPIIGMVNDALQINFDNDVGMSYIKSIKERAEYYHRKIKGISTGIPSLDKELGGGYMKKTLNLISAPSFGGKSALMACITSNMVVQKYNILYVTLEMSEEETAKRIDANVLDININELQFTKQEEIERKFKEVEDSLGELIIKEYPAGTFSILHLEALVQELKNTGFIPDVIMIDYLGLMASSRTTLQGAGGSYGFVKQIAEECHGFAKRYDVPLVSAAQLNRSAFGNVEVGMENISESIGLAATADTMVAMIATELMRNQNQVTIKFLKNRNTGMLNSLVLESNYNKMRYTDYDADDAEELISSTEGFIPNINNVNDSSDNGLDFGALDF